MGKLTAKEFVQQSAIEKAHADHSRIFADNEYVYPVLSRRAGGISVGINLNADKSCNFDCIYCQIDRKRPSSAQKINMDKLRTELFEFLELYEQTHLDELPLFADIAHEDKKLRDFCLSGDGEPTMSPDFAEVCSILAETRQQWLTDHPDEHIKLVLISNATLFHQDPVRIGLDILKKNNGEIWAKLDGADAETYSFISRSRVPLEQIVHNLLVCVQNYPTRIQSFVSQNRLQSFQKQMGSQKDSLYLQALINLESMQSNQNLKEIQLYSLARPPAEDYCQGVSKKILEQIRDNLQQYLSTPIKCY
jgi:wyosine [tRNA(Phe)-imidazoG37] synthetase (radical SAM superfamily)